MVYLGLQDAIKFLTRNECTLSVRVMHYIMHYIIQHYVQQQPEDTVG